MDLDNIKKTWQEAELKPVIDEEKIQKMISNEGRSAFNSLLRHEKMALIALVFCIPLGYLTFGRLLPVFLYYTFATLLGLFWQIYKLKKLKSFNLAEDSIVKVAQDLYWYRRIIFREIIVGLVWALTFFLVFGYFELLPQEGLPGKELLLLFCVLFVFIVSLLAYKYLYWNNIRRIEGAIKEVEEIENEK